MDRKSIYLFVLLLISSSMYGQTNIPIEMLFPEGKSKALILSYDDGRQEDRQLVQLMNTYQLVGTFHINANKLDTPGYLLKNEIKKLFKGHEVSVHSFNHPNLTVLSPLNIMYEIVEDRKALESLVGYTVTGMAYPFGNYNEQVMDICKKAGIDYARTVNDTYNFSIPTNFLAWHPTMHHFAKAYFEKNKPVEDSIQLATFYTTVQKFLTTNELVLLDVWGHSWELGNDANKWKETARFFSLVANNSSIYYTTQINLVNYINAFRQLQFSADNSMVNNNSAFTIHFKKAGKKYTVLPGTSLQLHN